jgi:ABC-type dipeptide/oligopeptide/nickel transport system permease component/ABC-type transport system substrate-binding protein
MIRFAVAFVVAAMMLPLTQPVAAKDSVVMALQLEPPNLDPTKGATPATDAVVLDNLYEGLVRIGENGSVQPGLATAWETAPDGRSYLFHLRQGVRFHDGAPFDASTVKFSLDRARATGSANAEAPYLAPITDIEIVDPFTVRLALSRPSSTLLYALAWGGSVIVAPDSVADDAIKPIGTGPFKFAGWRRGEAIELERNADYWGQAPQLRRVTFKFIADPNAAFAALKAGDVDAFPAFPAPETIAQLKTDPKLHVIVGRSIGKTILAINNREAPLNNLLVRRAISYAIDRKAIIDGAMFGFGEPIGSHFPPQDPAYVDLTGLYLHDPLTAKVLLKEAGYPKGFTVRMRLPPPSYARRSGEIIAAELAQIGITVKIETLEWAQWISQVFIGHDFDLSVVVHVEPMDYDIYTRDNYYFGYHSAALKGMVTSLDATYDPVVRTSLLHAIQKQIADDAVNGFLFAFPNLSVADIRLKGLWADRPLAVNDLSRAYWEDTTGNSQAANGDAGTSSSLRIGALVILGLAALIWLGRRGLRYLSGRFAALMLSLIVASILIFIMLQIAPGDPAQVMMGMNANPEQVAALRHQMGLDRPPVERYFAWIGDLIQGDFGTSYTYHVPVATLIGERLAITVPLVVYAMTLALAIGLPLGLLAAIKRGGVIDRAIGSVTQLVVALPNFWLAMLLILIFAISLRWFSAGGFPGWGDGAWTGLKALTLPALALAVPQAAVLARVLRGAVLEAMEERYIRTARAKGFSRAQAMWRHAVPNAAIPVLGIVGLQIPFLLAGGVLVETVFALPGLGRLIAQAINQRDLLVVQGLMIVLVFAVVVTAFIVDIAYVMVDPRLGRQS